MVSMLALEFGRSGGRSQRVVTFRNYKTAQYLWLLCKTPSIEEEHKQQKTG